jgi:hypothetical protein
MLFMLNLKRRVNFNSGAPNSHWIEAFICCFCDIPKNKNGLSNTLNCINPFFLLLPFTFTWIYTGSKPKALL